MKKTVFCTCVVFLVIGIAACKKTSTVNLAKEWRVISYVEETTTGNTVNIKYGVNSATTLNELIIDENGAWTWNTGSKVSGSIFGGSIFLTNKKSTKQQGTWNYVPGKTQKGKSQENGLLLFNVLSESNVSSQTGGGGNPIFPDTTVTTSHTYVSGENVIIYTVTRLTKEQMQMRSESSHFNASTGVTTSKKIDVFLEAK